MVGTATLTAPEIEIDIVTYAARTRWQDRQLTVTQSPRPPPVCIRRTPSPWQSGHGELGIARATGVTGGSGSGPTTGSHPKRANSALWWLQRWCRANPRQSQL